MRHTWYLVPYTKEPLIAIPIAGKDVQAQPSFTGLSVSNQTRHVSRKERNITCSTLPSYPVGGFFANMHTK